MRTVYLVLSSLVLALSLSSSIDVFVKLKYYGEVSILGRSIWAFISFFIGIIIFGIISSPLFLIAKIISNFL